MADNASQLTLGAYLGSIQLGIAARLMQKVRSYDCRCEIAESGEVAFDSGVLRPCFFVRNVAISRCIAKRKQCLPDGGSPEMAPAQPSQEGVRPGEEHPPDRKQVENLSFGPGRP